MNKQESQYALIGFDNTSLLIPQQEVSVVETIDTVEINSDLSSDNVLGYFKNDMGNWPVFAISADFTKRDCLIASDRYCICLQDPDYGQFGIICSAVSSFQAEENSLMMHTIAEIMLLPLSPILKLVYYQNYLYLLSNVEKLYGYLIEATSDGK